LNSVVYSCFGIFNICNLPFRYPSRSRLEDEIQGEGHFSPIHLSWLVPLGIVVILLTWPVFLFSYVEIYSWVVWPMMFIAVYANVLFVLTTAPLVCRCAKRRKSGKSGTDHQ
jgi:hypothetical protein